MEQTPSREACGLSASGTVTADSTPLRVVLADDHRAVRHGLSRLLTRAGFDVVGQADDGEAAVRLVLSLNPDVVLMDVNMPVLDGVGATRIICRQRPRVRVVAISTETGEHVTSAMADAGAECCLSKCAPPREIVAAMHPH